MSIDTQTLLKISYGARKRRSSAIENILIRMGLKTPPRPRTNVGRAATGGLLASTLGIPVAAAALDPEGASQVVSDLGQGIGQVAQQNPYAHAALRTGQKAALNQGAIGSDVRNLWGGNQ